MYPASLPTKFENRLGPLFQKERRYAYEGGTRGSVQQEFHILHHLLKLALPIQRFLIFTEGLFYTLGTDQVVFGEPIYFPVTIAETAKNSDGVTSFLSFLLSAKAECIPENQGLNYIKPVTEGNIDKVPSSIKNVLLEPIKQLS